MRRRESLHWPGIDWSTKPSPVEWHTVSGQQDTVLIVASGPSLAGFDFDQLRGKGFIIAVNGAADYVPFADAWITVDTLRLEQRLPPIEPRYIAAPIWFGQPQALFCDRKMPAVECRYLKRVESFTEDPRELAGGNSALGALNLAHHLKAKRVVLFGVDGHSFDSYFYGYRRRFAKQDQTLRKLPQMFAAVKTDMDVLNASPTSAVDCFPRMTPTEALSRL
jgi:hypothetical protein